MPNAIKHCVKKSEGIHKKIGGPKAVISPANDQAKKESQNILFSSYFPQVKTFLPRRSRYAE